MIVNYTTKNDFLRAPYEIWNEYRITNRITRVDILHTPFNNFIIVQRTSSIYIEAN